ncbi:beta strand repeat-containing protein [Paraburkholderia pallida]|nr:filamentous hemagglutinin N-terminal domain-containing protein [Paraburkholderia pallida]
MNYNKSTRHKRSQSTRQQAFRLAVMPAMLGAALGYANGAWAVQGGVVAAGSGTINTSGNNTTITQSTDRMVVNWTNFDIAKNQAVAIKQPSATSAVLNRVATATPTQIDGTLTANGRVFVVNPAGVMFGKTSTVNVGSLVASTLNVDDKQFMDGGDARGVMNLSANGGSGVVSNDGQLNATEAVVLLGAKATNQGTIRARDVTLGAADGVAMQMSNSGFKVMLGREAQNALAANSGVISAKGGDVQLNAAATGAMLATVVQNTGTIEATRASSGEGGSVILGSQLDGNVSAGGQITAGRDITIGSTPVSYPPFLSPFNANTAPTGGDYASAGHNVVVENGATLNASQGAVTIGTAGGNVVSNGRINSGGDVKIGAGGVGSLAVNGAVNGGSVSMQGTGVDINGAITASTGDVSVKADAAGLGNLNQNANLTASKGSVLLTGTNVLQKNGVTTNAGDGISIGAGGTIQAARLIGGGDVQLGAVTGPLVVNSAINGRSVSMQGTGVETNASITASTGDVSIKANALGTGDLKQNADITASKGSVLVTGTNVVQKTGVSTTAGNGISIGAAGTLQAARLNATGDVQIGTAVGPLVVNNAINGRSVSMQGTGVETNASITASTGDVSIKANGLGQGDLKQNADITASKGSVLITGTNVLQKNGVNTNAGSGISIGAAGTLQAARLNATGDVQIGTAVGPLAVNSAINGRSVSMQGTGVDINASVTASTGDVAVKSNGMGDGDLNQNANITASKGSVLLTGTNVVQKNGVVTNAGDGISIGADGNIQTARLIGGGDVQVGTLEGYLAANNAINGRSVSMQGTGVETNASINASTGNVSIEADAFGSGDLKQNADINSSKGSVQLWGTNVFQKNGVNTVAGDGVQIGANDTILASKLSAGGDILVGTDYGPLAVNGAVNGRSVSMQGSDLEINAPITASTGNVSVKADGAGEGDLKQFANVTASKGSVLLTGTNVLQKSGVSTTAGGDVQIGASNTILAQRLNAGGDVKVGALGNGALTVNGAVNGRSVSMQGSGVDVNASITASTGDVSISSDSASGGNLKQYANITASKGSVYLTGSNVVQDYGVSTTAGQDVMIGTSGTLQTGSLSGKTVSLEGDTVYLIRDVNADGDIVVHSTNNVCVPGTGCTDSSTKGIYQLGNVTSRKGSVMMAVDPGISFDPITGIPTISYTGLIGQYPTSQTRAGVDVSLRAVAVFAANNTAGKTLTVESLAPTYWGKLKAPEIILPTPITVSDNGSGSDSSAGGR